MVPDLFLCTAHLFYKSVLRNRAAGFGIVGYVRFPHGSGALFGDGNEQIQVIQINAHESLLCFHLC